MVKRNCSCVFVKFGNNYCNGGWFIFFVKKQRKKYKLIPFYCVAIALFVTELINQIKNLITGYTFNVLPFEFCSFFTLWPMLVLCTRGKVQDVFLKIAFIWSLLIFVSMVFNPVMIYGDAANELYRNGKFTYNYVFHEFIICFFVFFMFLQPTKVVIKDLKWVICSFGVFMLFAIPFAHIFNVNFCNILSCVFSPEIEGIRKSCGQVVYTLIYAVIGTAFMTVGFFATYFMQKIPFKKKKNIEVSSKNE